MDSNQNPKGNNNAQKYPRKNDIFDLEKIPMEVLDRGWQDYRPYLSKIKPGSILYDNSLDKSADELENDTNNDNDEQT